MTCDEFWGHIRATRRKDPDAHAERLVARLAKLPAEEIVDFQYWWDRMLSEAYFWDLWGAAYYANGGCSDDGFDYFRNWLVLQGRDTFEAVVADPNRLADYVADGKADAEFMCECYPAWHAWDAAFADELGDGTDAAFNALYKTRHPGPLPKRAMGRRWDFDDPEQTRRRLPRFAGDE
jgi:hypothetical protein